MEWYPNPSYRWMDNFDPMQQWFYKKSITCIKDVVWLWAYSPGTALLSCWGPSIDWDVTITFCFWGFKEASYITVVLHSEGQRKRLDLGRSLVEAQELGMLRIEKLSGSSKNLNPFIPVDVFLLSKHLSGWTVQYLFSIYFCKKQAIICKPDFP